MFVELDNVSLYLPGSKKYANKKITKNNGGLNFLERFVGNKFLALKNLNLTINKGRYALIGGNGAGKTTLLRMLSGIYSPTYGNLHLTQYALPVLNKSVLTNPILTGIEASKAHYFFVKARYGNFAKKFDNIDNFVDSVFDFAELNDVRSVPLNQYSDGMLSRLIFSLYTSITHPFLAIDEGLGMADENFYKKSQKRFDEYINNSSLIIMASHSEGLLRRYCDKGILMRSGEIIFHGDISEAFDIYRR